MSLTTKIIIIVSCVLVLLLIMVLTSRSRIKKIYKKYLQVGNKADLTGSQFAAISINKLKLDNVKLGVADGELIDAYSPKTRMLIMSRDVCNKASLASLTIVSHELGHAVQHKRNSVLFTFCRVLGKLTRFTNHFILPLLLAGIIMLIFQVPTLNAALIVLYVTLGLFLLNIFVKLLNIPLEYDASRIALKYLKEFQFLSNSEIRQAKRLLNVAAQTYIASLFDGIIIFGNKLGNLFTKKKK